MLKSCSNIWSYGSNRAENVGTTFYYHIVAATRASKFGLTHDKIYNMIDVAVVIFQLNAKPKFESMTLASAASYLRQIRLPPFTQITLLIIISGLLSETTQQNKQQIMEFRVNFKYLIELH